MTRRGVPADQIARRLGLNERTVHRYRARLRESA
ncbi:helix-turn-helix domain-containing protein [Streptomyces mirabilis]